MKKELKAQVRLIPGSGGVFDVVVDGKMLFSKFDTYRFPQPGEIVEFIHHGKSA